MLVSSQLVARTAGVPGTAVGVDFVDSSSFVLSEKDSFDAKIFELIVKSFEINVNA